MHATMCLYEKAKTLYIWDIGLLYEEAAYGNGSQSGASCQTFQPY